MNLRISEKVQLMMEGSSETGSIPHMIMTIEPETEEKTVNIVQSVLHTLYLDKVQVRMK